MMTRPTVNLVPTAHLGRIRTRRCVRRWIAASVGVIALTSMAMAYIRIDGRNSGFRIDSRLGEIRAEVASLESALPALERAIADAQARAQVNRRLGSRPDWGVLLAVLDSARPSGLVFESCAVSPSDVEAAPMPDRLGPVRLEIHGLSGEQQSVQEFVVRLENTGLFDEVQLMSTSRRVVGNLERVEFHLVGIIGEIRVAEVDTP